MYERNRLFCMASAPRFPTPFLYIILKATWLQKYLKDGKVFYLTKFSIPLNVKFIAKKHPYTYTF